MELIRGQHNLRPHHHGCVATIGNFDGVHLGHQAILGQLADQGASLGLPTVVIMFEPQPQEFFAMTTAPPRLTRLREKLLLLQSQRVDRVLCLRFNQKLADMPAEAFIRELLVEGLGIRLLVVGDDFHFGRHRQGDFALLRQAGLEHGFEVLNTHTYVVDGERVSSSRARQALSRGELELAARLLGRPYAICGRVVHGDKRGRTLGFPTANIHLHRKTSPLSGVYAVVLQGVAPNPVPGMANIGRRPTVNGTREQLEVHLFDFNEFIYGRHVQVDFLQYLRPEWRFESLEALRNQIQQDARQARAFFATYPRAGALQHG